VEVLVILIGVGLTTDTLEVLFDVHPDNDSVYTNDAVPVAMPVTIPSLDTVAIEGLLLVHEPPAIGESVVVLPTHISAGPMRNTGGFGLTVMVADRDDTQPVAAFVKVNLAVPLVIPVTIPLLLIDAMVGFFACQVPGAEEVNVVLVFIQIEAGPAKVIGGLAFTVTEIEPSDVHPVCVLV
jgi:hypothetical protein